MAEKKSEFEAIVTMKLLSLVEEYQTKKEVNYRKMKRKGTDLSTYYLKDLRFLDEFNNLSTFLVDM